MPQRFTWPLLFALVLVGAVAASACGSDDGSDAPEPPTPVQDDSDAAITPGGVSAVGPGLSVPEAAAATLDQPLLVNGFIVARDQDVRLCELLLESFPPQCGGESLQIRGLDLATQPGLDSAQGVSWTPQPTQLLGDVGGGAITVSTTSLG